MASRGWEGVTPTDIRRRLPPGQQHAPRAGRSKFRAEPCVVTDGHTLYTQTDIYTAELATRSPLIGTGRLVDRAARAGISGQWFASTKEGLRYIQLKTFERTGAISELRLQVPYDLTVVCERDGRHQVIGKWIADFVYHRDGALVTEDTKGMKTPLYLRSKKHFQVQYGLPILET